MESGSVRPRETWIPREADSFYQMNIKTKRVHSDLTSCSCIFLLIHMNTMVHGDCRKM